MGPQGGLIVYLRLFRLLVHIAGCVEISGLITIFFPKAEKRTVQMLLLVNMNYIPKYDNYTQLLLKRLYNCIIVIVIVIVI
jgi:hypothetical protein